jgi:hypothetical protein
MFPFIFWIKMKDLKTLDTWNLKQLRNLRINLNNRIQTFQNSPKAKELQASHVLYGKSVEECTALLEEVKRTEKKLTRE